jgi:prepilin-type N-terminal cleavage/methylation domain-containing protein
MKPAESKHNSESGFTLIEVIATIIVMGILAAFFIHFMGTALNDSWRSVQLVADEAKAEGLMEKIIADYVERINDNNPDAALAAIKSLESSYESDPEYGLPVTVEYIIFNAGNEVVVDPTTSNNLKIVIEAPSRNLTTILTKSRTDSNDSKVNW